MTGDAVWVYARAAQSAHGRSHEVWALASPKVGRLWGVYDPTVIQLKHHTHKFGLLHGNIVKLWFVYGARTASE